MTGVGDREQRRTVGSDTGGHLAGERQLAAARRHGSGVRHRHRLGAERVLPAPLLDQPLDRRGKPHGVSLSGHRRGHAAGGIDEDERRPGTHPVGVPDDAVRVVQHGVLDAVPRDRVSDRVGVTFVRELRCVDPDDRQHTGEAPFEAAELLEHVNAVHAARGPEVQEDDAAPKIGQGQRSRFDPGATPRELRRPHANAVQVDRLHLRKYPRAVENVPARRASDRVPSRRASDHVPARRASDRARLGGQRLEDPERLRVLRATRLLDSAPEESFDRLTRLTAHLLSVPVAQVALVEEDRQFFKSRIVTDREAPERQTGLDRSFCKYVVTSGTPLVVTDSREVEILRDAPVSTEGEVIAYCGYPLRLSDGAILGTLCAVDRQPRDWDDQEVELLADVAAIVVSEIELRRQLDMSRRRSQDLADAASGLRALEGALEASSIEQEHVRAASLGLAATIAHEVRTPLFAIRGLAEVMLDEQERAPRSPTTWR